MSHFELKRFPDWQDRLKDYLREARVKEFRYAADGFDCCAMGADGARAITGEDIFWPWRGRYRNIEEASRLVSAFGGNLLHAVRRHMAWLGVPECAWSDVREGDLAAIAGKTSAVVGISVGDRVAVPAIRGYALRPLSESAAAWRIG